MLQINACEQVVGKPTDAWRKPGLMDKAYLHARETSNTRINVGETSSTQINLILCIWQADLYPFAIKTGCCRQQANSNHTRAQVARVTKKEGAFSQERLSEGFS